MKVFVTKYALTEGVQEVEAEIVHGDAYTHGAAYGPKDWHHSRAVAIDRAKQMRKDKIAELKKQITKLEALTFE